MSRHALGLSFLLLLIPVAAASQSPAERLRAWVEGMAAGGAIEVEGREILGEAVLRPFYENRDFEPAWAEPAQIDVALALLRSSEQHGLLPEDYLLSTLERLHASAAADPAAFDLLLSDALVRYVYSRVFGKVNPESVDHDINFQRSLGPGPKPHEALAALIANGDLAGDIDRITAHGPWYRRLQSELRRMLDVASQGGWPTISEGATLHPGDTSPRVAELRRRLAFQVGVEPEIDNGSDRFDAALKAAVRRFQRDHALAADGVVGPATLAALNHSVYERIDQLRLSLERLRWVSGDAENRAEFVAVNIAGFRLYLVKDGELAWHTDVMVGKPYRQTPIFRGEMQYIEFNPTWTVPPGIHRKDVLPAIKRDASYLSENHMLVLTPDGREVDPLAVDWSAMGSSAPFIFRQKPGPWNALGQMKFIFPNEHFVFLHDTNHRELFTQPRRAFSSGCIRVKEPMRLAELLLAETPGMNRTALEGIVSGGDTRRVNLKTRIPVYLLYLTAAPSADGSVLYLEDVYERDARLLSSLDAPLRLDLPD